MQIDMNNIFFNYTPGDLYQDIYTIPILMLLDTSVTYFIKTSPKPLFPFDKEINNEEHQSTRHTKEFATGFLTGIFLPVFISLAKENDNFLFWQHIRGITHAHLINEFFTISSKKLFGRHRPFYNNELKKNSVKDDDSLSFFSGHASHAFTAMSYLSSSLIHYSTNKYYAYGLSGVLYTAATWVAFTRAYDKQHHLSDVITGSIVGTIIGNYIFYKVVNNTKNHEQNIDINIQANPNIATYNININYRLLL